MADREKVIKGITHHKLGQCDMSGKICPYWVEDDHCSKKMLEDVLALLKEQEAVEPEKFMDGLVQRYKCRKCGKHLLYASFAKDNYCSKCGQAVKWDD